MADVLRDVSTDTLYGAVFDVLVAAGFGGSTTMDMLNELHRRAALSAVSKKEVMPIEHERTSQSDTESGDCASISGVAVTPPGVESGSGRSALSREEAKKMAMGLLPTQVISMIEVENRQKLIAGALQRIAGEDTQLQRVKRIVEDFTLDDAYDAFGCIDRIRAAIAEEATKNDKQ